MEKAKIELLELILFLVNSAFFFPTAKPVLSCLGSLPVLILHSHIQFTKYKLFKNIVYAFYSSVSQAPNRVLGKGISKCFLSV